MLRLEGIIKQPGPGPGDWGRIALMAPFVNYDNPGLMF
jgi:hypothetical protein